MSISAALKDANELAQRIAAACRGIAFPASDRARLSAALLDQTHEHHEAICYLLDNGLVGSAFALIRITFETTVRGIWLFRCATDAEVEQFKLDSLSKGFGKLLEEIEGLTGQPGRLSDVKAKYWVGMCSYAHGGYLQAVRRISPDCIGPNYREAERLEAVGFANFCLVLASVELCSLANREDIAATMATMLTP